MRGSVVAGGRAALTTRRDEKSTQASGGRKGRSADARRAFALFCSCVPCWRCASDRILCSKVPDDHVCISCL